MVKEIDSLQYLINSFHTFLRNLYWIKAINLTIYSLINVITCLRHTVEADFYFTYMLYLHVDEENNSRHYLP